MTGELLVDERENLLGKSTATFSPDRVYRYTLTRRWADGPLTMFVMLNPSTADALVDDPTIRRCVGFARAWGSAGLLVVNAFALRATNPAALLDHPDPVGPDNDLLIGTALATHLIDRVVAAWGTYRILPTPERVTQLRALLQPVNLPLLCLGVTRQGHPRHPLYLPATTPLTPLEEHNR
jgi:hypothetical protein